MKAQRQSMDRISALPQETIEKILSLMPIRDALRTSILSRKWRYSWMGMPRLVFTDREFVRTGNQDIDKYKFSSAIFHVLLLHRAPILEFSLAVDTEYTSVVSEIDQILLHLSRSNSIKKLVLNMSAMNLLPCSFLSLQGLEHLHLSYCTFELPLMNKGFSVLKSLRFDTVDITNKLLFGFLTMCPALEEFTWIADIDMEIKLTAYEFVELFKCLPLVQVLEIPMLYIKPLAAGGMPHKLPISLVHLRVLVLYVCSPELSNVLSVISSSPNLEKIKLEMYWDPQPMCDIQPFKNWLALQDYTGLKMDHFKELEITNFLDCASSIEFVKLVMAKSPMLTKAQIVLCKSVSVNEEVEMLRDLVHMPFPRASPTANLIIKRPKNHRLIVGHDQDQTLRKTGQEMKVPPQNSDRISGLPKDIIRNILTLMPIRDALRTSILSKKWRHCWTRMPKLVFDDHLLDGSSVDAYDDNYMSTKFVNAIFHVLFLHRGPISELCIYIDYNINSEIDLIILHLSRYKNIKKFIFECPVGYKLPSSFFLLQGLEHLELGFCKFELPSMFNGFSKLKSLKLHEVEISAEMLQRFLTKCPLLEEFVLRGRDELLDLVTGQQCTFVELFKCLPAVETVTISSCYFKHFAAGGMPQKLPTSLVHLKILLLKVCFLKKYELLSMLCVINSSPNLEKIQIKMADYAEQAFITLLDPQDYLDLSLDHLKEMEITSFHNYDPEMEFVKLIMAKSPLLKKARIELNTSASVNEENQMLRDLVLLPFPRASPAAKLIIERPEYEPVNTD